MKVILDTNFLRIPFQFKVDIFSELERILISAGAYELATISLVVEEVTAKAQASPQWRAALESIKLKNINVYPMEATDTGAAADTDAALLSFANPGDILCTQDKELKRLAKEKKVRVITMLNKSHLEEV